MIKSKLILWIIALILVVAAAAILVFKDVGVKNPVVSPSPTPSAAPSISEWINVDEPSPDQVIISPLDISGQARGNWFFEASFPIKIYDANGKELGVAVAQADGDWMTEDFVPFHATLEFNKPATTEGTLVLSRDNPSDLPENDASLDIHVYFDLSSWPQSSTGNVSRGECRATGCSGQICSDQSVVTTCEYSPEYACYKNAKCERQEDGKCGWTPTEELVSCLSTVFQGQSQ